MYGTSHKGVNKEQLFHEQRIRNGMQSFYDREERKYQGIVNDIQVTNGLVKEYLQFVLNIQDVSQVKMIRLTETPTQDKWKHACYMVGVEEKPVQQLTLHGTTIQYVTCAGCKTILYEFESLS